ncbi:MAG TPA: AMP-dependent synthetase/ligase [Thermoleophilaceae bacterium]|nr:AMP-dependent synthetase/ligase [Thermoleophilaceae bacterium]
MSTTETPKKVDHSTDAGTMSAMVLDAAERFDGMAVRYSDAGSWRDVSYRELGTIVREIGRGLIALGIEPGERVAILSQTRPEWTYADFGALCAGAVSVPVYQTNSPDECHYVLEHADARLVFCEDAEQLAKVEEVRDRLPELRHVVAFTEARDPAISLDELRARGREVPEGQLEERARAVTPDDTYTIIYTSGTTGPPKGCILTHGNCRENVSQVEEAIEFKDDPTFYVFLPLAHVLTRVVQMLAIDAGATLAYWQRDMKKVVEDLAATNPTHLPSVPRVFEKIYTQANAAEGPKRKILQWAVGVGRRVREAEGDGRDPGALLKAQHALADRLALSKIRSLFGSRMRLALSGAAPIDPEILRFFHAAGVPVLEGYGMTETSAVASVNTLEAFKFGTVGRPIPRCEIRVADDGEVLMRGANIFQGYYKNEEATRETLVDGWLHSGDLGEIDDEGYLKITGRKKDLIITSSGKNVTPSNIENALKQNRWISQAVVAGDQRSYLVALLTLDADEAPKLAEKVGAEADPAKLANHDGARAEIQGVVDEVNRRFARIEQIKRFAILDRDLSQEEGELTPTMKVKRNIVYEQHSAVFDRLYDGA